MFSSFQLLQLSLVLKERLFGNSTREKIDIVVECQPVAISKWLPTFQLCLDCINPEDGSKALRRVNNYTLTWRNKPEIVEVSTSL